MSHQRKRGLPIEIWPIVEREDSRGNEHETVDLTDDPIQTKAWIFPQRSSRAEVPGQQRINVIRVGVAANLEGVPLAPTLDLFAQARYMGKFWDVVSPPAYHHGTRHTRHWSVDLRERPSNG